MSIGIGIGPLFASVQLSTEIFALSGRECKYRLIHPAAPVLEAQFLQHLVQLCIGKGSLLLGLGQQHDGLLQRHGRFVIVAPFLSHPFAIEPGDLGEVLLLQVVLGPALGAELAGVDEHDLAGMALGLVDDHDDGRGGGVVEEVLRQEDHGLDQVAFLGQVALDEAFADVSLAVGALVATAPADRSGVQHHRHAPTLVE